MDSHTRRALGCGLRFAGPGLSLICAHETRPGAFYGPHRLWRRAAALALCRDLPGDGQVHWDYICCALATVADICIIPVQDYLGLGSEARINIPSVPSGNWKWRMKKEAFTPELKKKIRSLAEVYGRY